MDQSDDPNCKNHAGHAVMPDCLYPGIRVIKTRQRSDPDSSPTNVSDQ